MEQERAMTALGTKIQRNSWGVPAACLVSAIMLSGCGAVGSQPGSSTSATPASASPTPAASVKVLPDGELEAGTYTIRNLHGVGVEIMVTVPDGWEGIEEVVVLRNDVGLGFWVVDNVYIDPCHESLGLLEPPPGPTVHDLATALAEQPRRNGTDPTSIEVDGYAGELVTIEVPVDADLAACDDEEFGSWSGDHGARGHAKPGERDEVMIVDVDGVRLVIDASTFPGSSEEDVAELRSVIDSIQLAPAG
jgi:hypothetical protein